MSISKSNIKLIEIINRKLEKNVTNKRSLTTFKKYIDSIKGSITELKKFNEKANQLNDNVNTLSKLNKIEVNQRRTARELKSLSQPTFNYNKEIERSNYTFNLPVFKSHKHKITKTVDIINKYKLLNNKFVVSQKMKHNKPEVKALYRNKEVLQFHLKGKFTRDEIQKLGNKN